jgi:hypothetical protein
MAVIKVQKLFILLHKNRIIANETYMENISGHAVLSIQSMADKQGS